MTSVRAQITPDNSLGAESSSIAPDSIQGISFDRIGGGATRGANLFHSFQEFNVNNGQLVYFSNPAGIANILTRVTGVNRSNILGTLGVLGNANLFLINPNGIFFGPNASLDVRGSFLGSSANSLLFDNGFEFSATNPQAPPLLTVNIPIGLRFRDNPGEIRVEGSGQNNGLAGAAGSFNNPTLEVPVGENLTLVGGNVNLDGGVLQATGGRVQLGGLTAAGTVGINANQTLSFPDGVARGDVSLTNRAGINVIANQLGGGSIDINARNIGISELSLLTAGIPDSLGTVNNSARNITLNATGETRIDQSRIENNVNLGTIANSSNIDITTGSFVLTNRAELNASNFGAGESESRFAGDVRVTANGPITVDGAARIISDGFFGLIFLTSNNDSVNISDGSLIRTLSSNDITDNFSEININAPQGSVFLNNVFQISTTNQGTGFAGDITINARDQISIKNSQILSQGNRGRILIGDANSFSPALVMIEGANTLLNTSNGTAPNQNAGSISIAAGRVVMNLGEISSSTSGSGRAGDISVEATGLIQFVDNALFSNVRETAQNGQAGNINIKAGSFSLLNGAQLQSRVLEGGQGNGGNVTINVQDGTVRIAGRNSGDNPSGIFNDVEPRASGDAGNIIINAASIFLDNGALLRTTNAGDGFAGDIRLNARDQVSIDRSTIESTGRFGRIFIGQSDTTDASPVIPNNININNSTLSTTNSDTTTSAGNITLNARDQVSLNQSTIDSTGSFGRILIGQSSTTSSPPVVPNNININNSTLSTTNSDTTTLAGDITLNARDQISLNQSTIESTGRFGRIFIGQSDTTSSPPVVPNNINIDNSRLSTTNSDTTTFAGDIALNARNQISVNRSTIDSEGRRGRIFIGKNDTYGDGISSPRVVSINDISFLTTSNQSVTEALDTPINSGNISIDALDSIFLGNGSEITAFSYRPGNAGNVTIRSGNSVTLSGVAPTVLQNAPPGIENGSAGGFSSGLFSSSEDADSGAGGQILVETPNLRILDGAVISGRSRSAANAGNITVNSRNVELRGGGQILATAFNGGNAGNVDVTADSITISGTDPTFNTRFDQVAQQFGRDIAEQRIDPVQPESGIFVNSTGTGQGGNLSITGNSLSLDRGVLSASTQSGNGGDITLNLRNFLRLRNESLISTNAGGQQGGNGGNIIINSPFIVAFPRNNDITANGGRGSGGQVTINGIRFGINPLSAADLRRLRPNDLDPRQLPTSDITAISRDNPSLSGTVQVTSPDVDPSRGLVELPETVSDRTQQVAQNPCRQGIGNEFVVTGRGGLPTTPNQTLNSDNVRVDLLQPVASSGNSRSATRKLVTTVIATRVPAQGWIFNDKGQVVLTAYDPTNTGSQRSFSTAAACPAR